VSTPVSATLIALTVAALVLPWLLRRLKRMA